ncbi:MAG: FHA domain-containing protein, partial [Ilumatobacteraceae bacterium]
AAPAPPVVVPPAFAPAPPVVAPTPPPPAAPPAPAGARLRFDDGASRPLALGALIGRSPMARAEDAGLELVAIEDSTMSVSKTHLAVGVDRDGVWVEDRNSTNGVSVQEPDGSSLAVIPGRKVRILRGSKVAFGDRWLVVE